MSKSESKKQKSTPQVVDEDMRPEDYDNDDDPTAFLNALYGSVKNTNTGKTTAEERKIFKFPVYTPDANTSGGIDGTMIYTDSAKTVRLYDAICHAMIYMKNINKYFCTHCLSTIDKHNQSEHALKCFIAKAVDPKLYCGVCNAKNTTDTAVVHYNSAKHQARINFIKALVVKRTYYIDDDGVSFVAGSKTDKGQGYSICLDFLLARIKQSQINYSAVSLPGGKQMYRLMASIITNKDKGSDDIGSYLAQRNAIVKCFQFYRAELSGGRRLCYPASDVDDFIQVGNCAEALRELNMTIIDKSDIDDNQKKRKRERIDEMFSFQDLNLEETCAICTIKHVVRRYKMPLALDKMVTHLLQQLQ